jgi:hypothetical protein
MSAAPVFLPKRREEKRRIEAGGFAQPPGEGDDVIRHFESRDFFGAITWS